MHAINFRLKMSFSQALLCHRLYSTDGSLSPALLCSSLSSPVPSRLAPCLPDRAFSLQYHLNKPTRPRSRGRDYGWWLRSGGCPRPDRKGQAVDTATGSDQQFAEAGVGHALGDRRDTTLLSKDYTQCRVVKRMSWNKYRESPPHWIDTWTWKHGIFVRYFRQNFCHV